MFTFTITDEASGEQHRGTIPFGWHEVPLSAFLHYHQLQAEHGPARSFEHIVAALTGLPLTELLADERLAPRLAEHLGFFTTLPTDAPTLVLVHEGQTYHYTTDPSTLSPARYERLLTYLEQAELSNPIRATAHLLAVLYAPATGEATLADLAAQAEAFQRLPFDVAWPAYQHFVQRWASAALAQQTCEAAKQHLRNALTQTEQALQPAPGHRPAVVQRATRALVQRYLRSMRR